MLYLKTSAEVSADKTTDSFITPQTHKITSKKIETEANHNRSLEQTQGELVDNSLDAGATEIKVFINETSTGGWVESIVVADNGAGMDYHTLYESYTPGTDRAYGINENGKYGVGGTSSCLALGNKKTTATKSEKDGLLSGRHYDMTQIKKQNQWVSQALSPETVQPLWEQYSGANWQSGTVIKLERLNESIVLIEDPNNPGEYISNEKDTRPRKKFSSAVENAKRYIRRTFNQDMVMSNLKIYVNNEQLKPFCVIGSDLVKADVSEWKDLKLGSDVVGRYKTCNLVNCDDKDVEKNFSNRLDNACGYFFFRNGRLVTEEAVHKGSTGWNKGPSQHHLVRYGFVAIEFSSDKDSLYGVPNTKNQVNVDDALQDAIENQLKSFWTQVKKSTVQKDSAKISPKNKQLVFKGVIEKSSNKYVRPRNMKDENEWITEVGTKSLGSSGQPWIYNAIEKKLEINNQHKFVQSCFTGPNSTKYTMSNLTDVAVAFESAILELDDLLDAEAVDYLKDAFFRKLAAISG